jgi:CheY-like chemotaxis protein
MKNHLGAVELQSESGKGTEVRLYFPAAIEAGEVMAAPSLVPARGSGQRILYLDDEQPLVELAVTFLGRMGYSVSGFAGVKPALDCFRKDPRAFDLAVTDLNMPTSSGLAVAAELMKIRPDLPVVLTSGFVTEELKEKARHAGIRHVVYKPNTVDELCATIHSMMGEIRQP